MTEREIKQLLKLLNKFAETTSKEAGLSPGEMTDVPLNSRERGVISLVKQWVRWYGRDELSMEL